MRVPLIYWLGVLSMIILTGPSEDGRRPGQFYVNCSNLHTRGSYEMEALALHEAVPGHHLQTALAVEAKGTLPR